MKIAPNRRWLQFRLRTLFLTTAVFGIWLGWQVRVVHERKALLHQAEAYNGRWGAEEYYPKCSWVGDRLDKERSVPWLRKMLGDEEIGHVRVGKDTPQQFVKQLEEAFPGTDIVVDGVFSFEEVKP